jgi:hypothetical protein
MIMATRLSQKQVADDFYERCIAYGVPCFNKHDGKRGFFHLQGSYGGMQLQYRYICGGTDNLSSGFVGAREMHIWLQNFNPVAMYKYWRKREIDLCKNRKENDQRRREGQERRVGK